MTEEPQTEELAAPQPNRFVQALVILLALVVAVVVIIRVADSGSSHNQAAQVAPTTTAPPTVHSVPYTPPPVQPVIVPPFRNVPPCPPATDGQIACTTYVGLPGPTARALRERFPRIVIERAVTQMLRPSSPEVRTGMWSRQIRAHMGAMRVRIAIRRAEPVDRGATGLRLGPRFQLIRVFRHHFLIQVQLRGPVDPESLSRTIAWLLTDPRLVRPTLAPGGTMMR